jgi:hypothetical protein
MFRKNLQGLHTETHFDPNLRYVRVESLLRKIDSYHNPKEEIFIQVTVCH